MVESMAGRIRSAVHFLGTGIWRIRIREQPTGRGFLIKYVRMFLLAIRGFDEDKCQLRASALTYYTLLSIVPIAAMAFGVAKGFGFEERLEKAIYDQVSSEEQLQVVGQIIDFARNMLDNTSGGLIAGIGVAVLFWSVIKVLGNIEKSFNGIWGIKVNRSFGRKLGDYLSVMLIGPILMIASSSLNVFIEAQASELAEKSDLLAASGELVLFGLKFWPYALMWALFAFIYVFMPNGKVNLVSAVLGGILAGTIYQFIQWVYIKSQVEFSSYGAIYGSFAALPLFLIWLHTSWLIVLFGAEISFAHQNVDTYEFEPDCVSASPAFRKLMALRLTQMAIDRFAKGEPPLDAEEMAHELGVPIRLVRELLFELVEARILSEIQEEKVQDPRFQPGTDPDKLTIQYVLNQLDHRGTEEIPMTPSREITQLAESLREMGHVLESAPPNIRLKDL
jgi:membrane protein